MRLVPINPGQTQFTLIPKRASSSASTCVNRISPALVVE
jgi:hypothetical protein